MLVWCAGPGLLARNEGWVERTDRSCASSWLAASRLARMRMKLNSCEMRKCCKRAMWASFRD